nr:aspartate aminotransferase family protein [Pseudopedobacter sp.]
MLSHKQLFLLNTAQTSDFPRLLEIEKAEGCYLIDPTGRKYLDLVSGFAVSNLGHRHPNVIEAIKKQLDKYLHVTVYGEYIQAPQVLFAQKLSSVLPQNLSSVYFTNSGAEATEGALKLAKKFTNRSQIISFHHAYHGSTHGALSVMGNEYYKQAYRPLLPDIHFINLNNKEQLDDITSNTAAVILEAIQGEAGVRVPDADYLKALRAKCNETGAVLIFDEIQTGFGRTGKLFAFEHFDVIPDILLLAKGMGGGMPIGAFIASKKMMDVFKDNPILGHITTFGG